ncbi:MAG: peptidase U32 family protein [Bacillota bacterium]
MGQYKKPELLAPAGNLEKLKTAIVFGADAVYFGLPDFSLRLRVNDFSLRDIKSGIAYAHAAKKKAYVTVNIFARDRHFKKLEAHILKLKEYGADAIFISDPGVARIVKKVWPKARLSLSTQANCTNLQSALFWREQGFRRLILSRELKLAEVKAIKDGMGDRAEIEVFVHGALCAAYSGRCFLSDYFVGRSANLGDCSQPCRWEYEIKPRGHEASLLLGEDRHGSYLLNSMDLCLIARIPELISAGVDAMKIEGRAKSVYYLANVVGAYRRAIDLCFSGISKKEISSELTRLKKELTEKLNNRRYCEGFMFESGGLQNYQGNEMSSPWEFCGQVLSSTKKDGRYELQVRAHNTILNHGELEIVGPSYELAMLDASSIRDAASGGEIEEAHGGGGGTKVIISSDRDWPVRSVLRRRI